MSATLSLPPVEESKSLQRNSFNMVGGRRRRRFVEHSMDRGTNERTNEDTFFNFIVDLRTFIHPCLACLSACLPACLVGDNSVV